MSTTTDGTRRFRLGAVELGILAAGVALTGWLLAHQYQTITQTQAETSQKMGELVTQVAVLNGQMQQLSTQLADVPALTRQVAQMQVEQQEHERRISKLEDGNK